MATHNFKCSCGQCSRILVVDDETGIVRLDDYLLGFSEEMTPDDVDTQSSSLMLKNAWTMSVREQTLPQLKRALDLARAVK